MSIIKSNIILLCIFFAACSIHHLGIKEIESSQNALIGKVFVKSNIDKLINETEDYQEYETELGNGCTFAVKVIKPSMTVTSWRLTSDRKPCDEGITFYGH